VLARGLTAIAAALVPATLAFRSGGYFPSDWGVELLALTLIGLAVVILRERPTVGRVRIAMPVAILALAVWTALSAAWSPGADGAILAAELALVYATGTMVVALGVTRETVESLLLGFLAGIAAVAMYALWTRLVEGRLGNPSDPLSGTRLIEPIGYANGLGALMAIGCVVGLGLAAVSATRALRALSAASLVPLAAALYLTLSRGSYVALAAGVVGLVAYRGASSIAGRLLVLGPVPIVATTLTARSPLTSAALTRADAQAAGSRLAWELAALTVISAGLGVAASHAGQRLTRAALVVCSLAACAVVVAVLVAGPARLAHDALHRLREQPPATGSTLGRRVLSVSDSGRTAYWHVAARMIERRPLLGEGGGSFERWWLQERPVANDARNAHSLYLETLAELGPLGLALLAAGLAVPFVALHRVKGDALAAIGAAAYLVWIVHAAIDWDWQIPAITLVALGCGCVPAIRAGADDPPLRRKPAWIGGLVLVLAVAFVANAGNRASDAARAALASGDESRAAADARTARRWMPWAATPWRLLGEAELALREDAAARASLHEAISRNAEDWIAWYDLAQVTAGQARRTAIRRARLLDPLAPELSSSG
jgi:hypothetical protein